MNLDQIAGLRPQWIGYTAFHHCACQTTPAIMRCRLTSSAGTFAVRDHLSIPIRFLLYNDTNVFSHRNTSFVIFCLYSDVLNCSSTDGALPGVGN
jgi:hypothetical protein